MYEFEPVRNMPYDLEDIGHLALISGMLFQGHGESLLLLLPDSDLEAVRYGGLLVYTPTEAEWAAIVRASDDPKYLDPMRKIWMRKSQRLISGKVQQYIWARDGFRCMYCGRSMGVVQLTVDHFVPLELEGENNETNYLSACRKCNKDKGAMHPRDWCEQENINFDILCKYLDDQ
jgi:hypothetical protein